MFGMEQQIPEKTAMWLELAVGYKKILQKLGKLEVRLMRYFIGYHGTSSVFAEKILQTNFLIDHIKVGWLGTGIYLFEENQELARSWAKL